MGYVEDFSACGCCPPTAGSAASSVGGTGRCFPSPPTPRFPYRQIARLTVGRLRIGGGGDATITDAHGADHVLASTEDPVLCGPCALVRWRRLLNITHTKKTHMDDFLATAKPVTSAGHHPCRAPKPIDPRRLEVALFPPINQWGHFAVQMRPLTPHAISRQARQPETGLLAQDAPRRGVTAVLNNEDHTTATETVIESVARAAPPLRPVWDWAAASERKSRHHRPRAAHQCAR